MRACQNVSTGGSQFYGYIIATGIGLLCPSLCRASFKRLVNSENKPLAVNQHAVSLSFFLFLTSDCRTGTNGRLFGHRQGQQASPMRAARRCRCRRAATTMMNETRKALSPLGNGEQPALSLFDVVVRLAGFPLDSSNLYSHPCHSHLVFGTLALVREACSDRGTVALAFHGLLLFSDIALKRDVSRQHRLRLFKNARWNQTPKTRSRLPVYENQGFDRLSEDSDRNTHTGYKCGIPC